MLSFSFFQRIHFTLSHGSSTFINKVLIITLTCTVLRNTTGLEAGGLPEEM